MPRSKRRLQKVAREVRNARGIEMTPDEVDVTLTKAYDNIRRAMLSKGYVLPNDDNELLKIIREVFEEERSE